MEPKKILYVILKNWLLISILLILGGTAGYLSAQLPERTYEAEVKMYIKSIDRADDRALSMSDFTLSEYLVQQYSQIISSRTVLSAIMDGVRQKNVQDITEEELTEMIRIDSNEQSNIFSISAIHTDPYVAAAVADATSDQFSIQLNIITNSETVGILDEAQIPELPVPDRKAIKVLFGMIAGGMIALAVIWIREYFRTAVRTEEDIEKSLGLPLVGIIPEHDI